MITLQVTVALKKKKKHLLNKTLYIYYLENNKIYKSNK